MQGCERCLCNRIQLDVNVYGLYLFEQDMFVYFSKFNCWHQFLFVNILAIKICPLGIWDHKEAFRSAVVTDEKNISAKIIFAVNSSDIYRLFVKRALVDFKRKFIMHFWTVPKPNIFRNCEFTALFPSPANVCDFPIVSNWEIYREI